ncbi:MAG TPA: CoA-binding protein [Chitinophagales bacterium]|nr:CoA-binding protein [Chitinophagales bacterium]
MKKTLVLGATPDETRYAWLAATKLMRYGHPVVLVGNKRGDVNGQPIINGQPDENDVDTVTLYMNPKNQETFLDYIVGLKPKRIIFNPGTENDKLIEMAEQNGIEPVIGCTLVMLSSGEF